MSESVRRDRQLRTERLRDPNRRLSDPETDEMLVALKAGVCPFCGLGPFTVVALHVSISHGVSSATLRAALGIDRHEVICDPAHHVAMVGIQKTLGTRRACPHETRGKVTECEECQSAKRQRRSLARREMLAEIKRAMTRECARCGREFTFEAKYRSAIKCEDCKRLTTPFPADCVVCGSGFTARHRDRKTCSRECELNLRSVVAGRPRKRSGDAGTPDSLSAA